MSAFPPRLILVLAVVAALAFGVGYGLRGGSSQPGMAGHDGHDHAATSAPAEAAAGPTVWTCSMHPQIQLPEAGQCPICFMDLIPLAPDEGGGEEISLRQVKLSAAARKLAQVAVAPVKRRELAVETRMVGTVAYDETRMGAITAWVGGRLDDLYVDATGDVVKRGQAMASIYSPELLTAQAELVEAERTLKALGAGSSSLVRDTAERTKRAAMEKLRLLGLSKRQIDRVLSRGKPRDHVTLYAPMGGVVIEKNVVEGQYVATGAAIYRIADLSKVWVVLEAYESDLPWIQEGAEVDFTVESLPGKVFTGTVVFINQVLDDRTRTVDIRLAVDNPGYALKPGMLVKANQRGKAAEQSPLVIPASAPLITGKRAVVYVAVPDNEGTYEGRQIVLGPRAGDHYVVEEGLAEGEMVVVKGNFKLDSALQIQAKPSMMNPSVDPATAMAPGQTGQSALTATEPEFDVDMGTAFQLAKAAGAFDKVTDAVIAGNLEAARSAFAEFHDRMSAVEPTSLEGEAALHWRELSTLLKNDGMLGKNARDMRRARRIHTEAWAHFKRLAELFPTRADAAKRFTVPEMFRQQLAMAFEVYIDVSEALANDDPVAAQAAAIQTKSNLGMVNLLFLDGDALNRWMELRSSMNQALDDIAGAADIDAMRIAFEPLSLAMVEAATRYGLGPDAPVFVLSCPMAFDNKGATWLQSDDAVRNPYFGAAMYRCGEVLYRVDSPQ